MIYSCYNKYLNIWYKCPNMTSQGRNKNGIDLSSQGVFMPHSRFESTGEGEVFSFVRFIGVRSRRVGGVLRDRAEMEWSNHA